MDIQKFFQSKGFRYALYAVTVALLLLVAFNVGELVGFQKARFSYAWGEQYYRSFAGPAQDMGPMGGFSGDSFMMGHGTSGSVLTVGTSSLVIEATGGSEKTIMIENDTAIKYFRNTISIGSLNPGDQVIVVGSPDDAGQIDAELIRVMIAVPSTSSFDIPPAQWL